MQELVYAISELRAVQGTVSHHVSTDFCSIPTNTLITLKEMHSRLQEIVDDLQRVNNSLEAEED